MVPDANGGPKPPISDIQIVAASCRGGSTSAWRRRRRGCRGGRRHKRSSRRERDRGGLPFGVRNLEKGERLEMHDLPVDVGGERLERGVEIADVAVVEAPRELHLVLGRGQLLLEVEEQLG